MEKGYVQLRKAKLIFLITNAFKYQHWILFNKNVFSVSNVALYIWPTWLQTLSHNLQLYIVIAIL